MRQVQSLLTNTWIVITLAGATPIFAQVTRPAAKPAKTPLPEITITLGDDDAPAAPRTAKPVARAAGSTDSMDPASLTPGARKIYDGIMKDLISKNPALADSNTSIAETTRNATVILARKNDELDRAAKAWQAAAEQINNVKGLTANFTAPNQIENRILMFEELGAKSTLLGQVIVDSFGSIEKDLSRAGVQGSQIKGMTDSMQPNLAAKMKQAKAGAAMSTTGQEALRILLEQWGKWDYKEGSGVQVKPEFDAKLKDKYNGLIELYNRQRNDMDKAAE